MSFDLHVDLHLDRAFRIVESAHPNRRLTEHLTSKCKCISRCSWIGFYTSPPRKSTTRFVKSGY